MERKMAEKYWTGNLGPKDDFGRPYGDLMYDGRTNMGPWANMSHDSWMMVGVKKLGTGYGQKYRKQADGRWLKVEG
jgi:hypothetical protein